MKVKGIWVSSVCMAESSKVPIGSLKSTCEAQDDRVSCHFVHGLNADTIGFDCLKLGLSVV